MNEKVLNTLEFHKITQILSSYAGSEPAKNMCLKLRPSSNMNWITKAQGETEAALSRLLRDDRISFGSNKDIRMLLKNAQIGHTLSMGDLLCIARVLECAQQLCAYAQNFDEYNAKLGKDSGDILNEYFHVLDPLPTLCREIRRAIISEEEISDDASADLKKIRKSYVAIGEKIHNQLTHMVNSSYRSYLQEPVITMRNDRYCIPVKTEYKSQVPGMIHDQSSSGSTLFIEPASVVNLGNERKELELKERDEIERILIGLTARVAANAAILNEDQKAITMLDFIFAKGKYALKLNATKPIFNEEHRLHIRQARHPLLDPATAVPIDVRLGEDFDLLIVTGPNTGGKTVSLKTVGLLTLMGQAGLHIPARDLSELGFFKEIYADIGDEQSIEQSLSTFSAHMTSIVDILKKADADSLCLFDELGAGTDPTEGAALAISILTYLHDRGIRSMATTHYSELKIFALSTSFVENACCEFDVESLRPTYRLLIGIPGKSNAFAISAKLGLPGDIIEDARKYISSEEESFENVISDLERQRIQIEKEEQQIAAYKAEIQALKEELAAKQEKLENQRERILRDARTEAKEILQDAKDVADETIRVFQKQGHAMTIQTMEKKRQNVRSKISEQSSHLVAMPESKTPVKGMDKEKALPGTWVHIVSLDMDGTITGRPDNKGKVAVQCGIISTKAKLSDLIAIDPPAEPKKTTHGNGKKVNISKGASIPSELNVLGLTVDEAVLRVDKYIDDACLCHVSTIRIVHGKGTGALRSGIHDFLRTHPSVSNYHLAAYGEGDAGVTIVEL